MTFSPVEKVSSEILAELVPMLMFTVSFTLDIACFIQTLVTVEKR